MVSLQELTRQLSLLHEAQWSASSERGRHSGLTLPERVRGSRGSQAHPAPGNAPGVWSAALRADIGQPGRTGMQPLLGAGWQTARDAPPGIHSGAPENVGGQGEAEGLLLQPEITGPMYESRVRVLGEKSQPTPPPACRPAGAVFCPQWTRRTLERLFHPRLWQKEGWCVAVSDLSPALGHGACLSLLRCSLL